MPLSLHLHRDLHLLLSFSFLFFTPTSNADDSTPANYVCSRSSQMCGDVNISYPFWQINSPDSSTVENICGFSVFGLYCPNKGSKPTLNLSGDNFIVKDINYSDYTLTLVDADTQSKSCPRVRGNITLNDTFPFKCSPLDMTIIFYFNCTTDPPPPWNLAPIECLKSGENMSYILTLPWSDVEVYDWSRSCEEIVAAYTVMKGSISNDTFDEAMNNGFVLNWMNITDCPKCEASGGMCGFDNSTTAREFLCFCNNGKVAKRDCSGSSSKGKKIAIGLGSAAGAALILVALFLFYQRNKKRHYNPSTLLSRGISSYPSSVTDYERGSTYFGAHIFPYVVLEEATNNFDSSKELGDGGFGTVYHGKLRDGRDVAVKKLYENNYKRVEQFMNEVEILSKLRHPNLVTLYGCTSRHSRELILVYEYIPNGTVADHLHGEQARPRSLPWATRLSIAIETASALSYLHHSGIIHRDVKTNNILLDNNFLVKVADFGLSRLFPTDVTHVSTAPQGTPGYLDPEYHECYHLTDKSDVYSFGVVLVELITSMPAVDITRNRHEINLSNMFIKKIQNGQLHELVDPNFGFGSDFKVDKMIMAVAELAFQCLQSEREIRPTMEEVLEALKCIQSGDFDLEKESGVRTPADDVALLKKPLAPFSPDSVTAPWTSRSTTSNDSGSVS